MVDDTESLYPDLVAAGGLGNALQAALKAVSSRYQIALLNEIYNLMTYARVEFGSRSSHVKIGAKQRIFQFACCARGVLLANGQTQSLHELALAIDRWLGSHDTAAELAAQFPFVTPEEHASVYERGLEVEERWREYLTGMGKRFPQLVQFLQAAAGKPKLRRLFPFTSMTQFCFSRCTGYPFTRDTPIVQPLPAGIYEVVSPDGQVLGRGNGEEAAGLVVQHLPPGCGAAVAGTADDLARASL